MLVEAGGATYGWGGEARDLPTNPDAYGAKRLTEDELITLGKAIREVGWEPFWASTVNERVVFLVGPNWRQSITAPSMAGQTYQVREAKRRGRRGSR